MNENAQLQNPAVRISLHHTTGNHKQQYALSFIHSFTHSALCGSENCQDGQEEVDNVEIQRDRCPNILIIGISLDEIVSIIDHIPTENDGCQDTIDHYSNLTQRHKHLRFRKKIVNSPSDQRSKN